MSNILREHLSKLRALEMNPCRNYEHRILDRIMYKNRNQHRKGIYFKKLEHVRRVLRQARHHPGWAILHWVDTPQNQKRKKRKRDESIPISSLTLMDFEELSRLLENLVSVILPKAALRITIELICRQHFLPFAITSISLLARIFVIEQKVLQCVNAVAANTRILMAVPKDNRLAKVLSIPDAAAQTEDIGEVVCASSVKDAPQECIPRANHTQKSESEAARISNEKPQGILSRVKPHALPNAQATKAEQSESLYDIMALHDPALAQIAESNTKTNTMTPFSVPGGRRATFEVKISAMVEPASSKNLTKTAVVEPEILHRDRGILKEPTVEMLQRQQEEGPSRTELGKETDRNPESSSGVVKESSEYEALDDMFAALD